MNGSFFVRTVCLWISILTWEFLWMGVANAIFSLNGGYEVIDEGVSSLHHLGLKVLNQLLVCRIELDTGRKPNHVLAIVAT